MTPSTDCRTSPTMKPNFPRSLRSPRWACRTTNFAIARVRLRSDVQAQPARRAPCTGFFQVVDRPVHLTPTSTLTRRISAPPAIRRCRRIPCRRRRTCPQILRDRRFARRRFSPRTQTGSNDLQLGRLEQQYSDAADPNGARTRQRVWLLRLFPGRL